ncbi:hypothetical protein CHUAL_011237 [Chamberlinius hualienensis]
MSTHKKKRVENHEGEEEIDSDESLGEDSGDEIENGGDSGEEDMEDQILQVDFEAREPSGGDFDGIRCLLQQLILKEHVNTSALADIIIQQNYVGNVLQQVIDPEDEDSDDDGEEDIFGITTVLNITERQEEPCIQELRKLLLVKSNQHASLECQHIMNQLLLKKQNDEFHVGFIVNERFANIPAKICGPSLESLLKDIQDGVRKNRRLKFDHYILMSKVYKANEKKRKGLIDTNVYPKLEVEIFKNEALVWFEYSISGQADTGLDGDWDSDDEGNIPFHQVIIIQSSKFDSIISQIKAVA